MTWQVVAQKDFQDAVRSRWLWGLSLFFVLFIALGAYITSTLSTASQALTSDALFSSQALVAGQRLPFAAFIGQFIALVAFVVAYQSLIGERESGTMKLLLSLPHSRRDTVLGKLLGRSAVVVFPVLTGFLIGALVFLTSGVQFAAVHYFVIAILAALLGVVFVAIAVAISALANTGRQATTGVVGFYFLVTFFWGPVRRGLLSLLYDLFKSVSFLPQLSTKSWMQLTLLVKYVNPLRAYETLTATQYTTSVLRARLVLTSPQLQPAAMKFLGNSLPFYLSNWFVALVLALWIVVPLWLGFVTFREADL